MEKIFTFVKRTYEISKEKIMSYDDKNVTENKCSKNKITRAKSEPNLDELKQKKNDSEQLKEIDETWGWFYDPEQLMRNQYYKRRNSVFTYDSRCDIQSKTKG